MNTYKYLEFRNVFLEACYNQVSFLSLVSYVWIFHLLLEIIKQFQTEISKQIFPLITRNLGVREFPL